MMWVCPLCWELFSIRQDVCPRCGAALRRHDRLSDAERLLRALDHRDAGTAMRAAGALARWGDPEQAIPALILALRRRRHEPHVAAALVRALGAFGSGEAHEALIEALGHPSVIVRAAAAECLQARPAHRPAAKTA